jgi:hypothetical protein
MPQIETWSRLPQAIRDHLIERMHDRKIGLDDLNRLRIWMNPSRRCRKALGTRILVRLSSAVRVDTPRHFFSLASLLPEANSDSTIDVANTNSRPNKKAQAHRPCLAKSR